MPVRKIFNEQLNELHQHLLEMGMLVNEAIYKAVKSLVNRDHELAENVIASDRAINNMELALEQRSFELIALQQPVGIDLRKIVTVLKASSDLERIGDHAVSIAKTTILVGRTKVVKPIPEIQEMGDIVKIMVHDVLKAYLAEDEEAAREIASRDNEVDKLQRVIYTKCIHFMQEDPDHLEEISYLLLVAQYLERIGDYVTNVCEWIVYLKSGEIEELNN
ncbi:phosphate transport system regulatory protein PhoU [Listeria newyorkensis]|uniref:Phosphate-specific transport system accessory protein PhoU n=1 Tax=Listeria newyorkensis TaxID=1497681 RepID=A0A841YUA2_9LIST|nr:MULTISPECIES: phosphate signaling complex protein PhoU [Listeria]KGL46963.1 PhoU family transcriptional regulator [Listeriaceae bacterium FSL A5-0209]KGL45861.1 PhoU family transcriptional regulator [Listeria newyorkensis]KMT58217.1 phosphate transport system protein [Listeria newyorkensis]MBC1456865.1 phosphate signaling complex protein PhoU [Listeria newyorkensis]PNP90212.1 phosphate transport system regulatory protein PhoU [Listeria newyorkensis]